MHVAVARFLRLGGLWLVLVASLSLASGSGAGSGVGATTIRHHVKRASVALGNCTAKDIDLQARIPRSAYSASQPVRIVVVVHNVGARTCTFGGTGHRYPEFLGPCGAISLQVYQRGGAPIWPGPIAYNCPAISATNLAPGATFTASGTWPKAIVTRSSSSRAPPGTYRVVVDQAISFTITLT
jgi:hypothetical protein